MTWENFANDLEKIERKNLSVGEPMNFKKYFSLVMLYYLGLVRN